MFFICSQYRRKADRIYRRPIGSCHERIVRECTDNERIIQRAHYCEKILCSVLKKVVYILQASSNCAIPVLLKNTCYYTPLSQQWRTRNGRRSNNYEYVFVQYIIGMKCYPSSSDNRCTLIMVFACNR